MSKDFERGAAVFQMKGRAVASETSTRREDGSEGADDAHEPESDPELIERALEMHGCCGLDRSSIEALEALLTQLEPADELRLALSLGEETPVRLGIALADDKNRDERREALTAALDFAAALLNARRQP